MLDPEGAYRRLPVAEGEARVGLRVGEAGGVEVELDALRPRPLDPGLEVLGRDLIAIDMLAPEVPVAGVKVEPVSPGDQGEGLVQVRPQLFQGARLARVAACHEYPAPAQGGAGSLEPADIIPLPYLKRQRQLRQPVEHGLGVHAELGVALFRQPVGLLDHHFARSRHNVLSPAGFSSSRKRS